MDKPATLGRWLGKAVLVVVVILLALYVLRGFWGMWQVHRAKADAADSVSALEGTRADVLAAMDPVRAALGDPVQAWSQVVCELSSNDSGWFVNDYTQRCWMEVVDVYAGNPAVEPGENGIPDDVNLHTTECPDAACVRGPVNGDDGSTGRGARAATPAQWTVQGDLGPGPHLVVIVEGSAVTTVLGCSPWSVPFCGEPVDRPIVN